VETDPAITEHDRPEPPQRLSLGDWACLAFFTLLLVGSGIGVIVTHEAKPFRGQGPVTLDPVSAWVTGLAMIALGLGFPPLVCVYGKHNPQPAGAVNSKSVRRIRLIDTLFAVAAFAAMAAWGWLFVRAVPGRWSLAFAAVLATSYAAYKIGRLVLEYRAGVAVPFGRRWRAGSEYDRATQPLAFWWAMGIEAVFLMLGAGATVILWVIFASD
jgi:hypothetical protein